MRHLRTGLVEAVDGAGFEVVAGILIFAVETVTSDIGEPVFEWFGQVVLAAVATFVAAVAIAADFSARKRV